MERNYLDYLTYVSMFPQLVAGPIVRYSVVNEELRHREIKKEEVTEGLFRFMQGLFKKVLIANQAGALWEEIRALEAGSASVHGWGRWRLRCSCILISAHTAIWPSGWEGCWASGFRKISIIPFRPCP